MKCVILLCLVVALVSSQPLPNKDDARRKLQKILLQIDTGDDNKELQQDGLSIARTQNEQQQSSVTRNNLRNFQDLTRLKGYRQVARTYRDQNHRLQQQRFYDGEQRQQRVWQAAPQLNKKNSVLQQLEDDDDYRDQNPRLQQQRYYGDDQRQQRVWQAASQLNKKNSVLQQLEDDDDYRDQNPRLQQQRYYDGEQRQQRNIWQGASQLNKKNSVLQQLEDDDDIYQVRDEDEDLSSKYRNVLQMLNQDDDSYTPDNEDQTPSVIELGSISLQYIMPAAQQRALCQRDMLTPYTRSPNALMKAPMDRSKPVTRFGFKPKGK